MKLKTIAILSVLAIPLQVYAQDMFAVTVDESYDDMTFAVESAILDRGLNIDTVSHVGDMLARTAADVGADGAIFTNASVFNFCSAVLSRDAMALDPANIRYCPYGIFVYSTADNPDQTIVGHQIYGNPDLAPVNTLLDEIVQDATQ